MLTLLGQQLFPADNPWNQNIASAPVAANSAAVISNIGASVRVHPDWGDDNPANGNAPLYGIPVNIVHGTGMQLVNVQIDNFPDESDITGVPIPPGAVLEGDYQNGPNLNGGGYGENGNPNQRGDSHLIVYDEDSKITYEFYGVSRPNDPTLFPDDDDVEAPKTDALWHAAQETVWDMKTDEFRTIGATSADAAGLPILAGLARPDEGLTVAQGGQGAITHALRFTLPRRVVNPQYIYPASHMVDETQGANNLPFGGRLRLANTTAVNMKIAAMPPESQIIAHAMQQYGLILADNGTAMYVTGASSTTDNVDSKPKLVWDQNDIFANNGLRTLVAGDFQVVDLTPRVTRLSATSGSPGSMLTFTGQNFSGAAGNLYVNFGGTQIGPVTPVSDTQINVTIPSGSGTVDIIVQSGVPKSDDISDNLNANVTKPIFGYGTSATSSADQFTFVPAGSLTLTWNGTSNGNWTDPQWTGAGFPYPDGNINAVVHTASVVQVSSPQAAYSLALSGGGQVAVGAGASLAVTTSTSVTGSSTLNLNASGTFSTGGTFTLDTGSSVTGGHVSAAAFQLNDGTASASLSGPGGLTKATTGTVTLSGANTYQGATTVSSGTLIVSGAGALPIGTSLIIGGTSGAPAKVIIAATDASGHPLSESAAGQANGTAAASDASSNQSDLVLANPLVADLGPVTGLFSTPPNVDWKTKHPVAAANSNAMANKLRADAAPQGFNAGFGTDRLDVASLRGWKWLGAELPDAGDGSTPAGLTSDLLELLAMDRLRFA